jgi:hypothetical protein
LFFHMSCINNLFCCCLFILFFLLFTASCPADELDPRRWTHLPINTNFFGTAYSYTDADISFDPVLKIEKATMEMHTWAAKYIRTFALFDKTARIDLLQAYQEGRWSGKLDGVSTSISRSGLSDTFLRFSINLYGAPPLEDKKYAAYRAKTKVETIVGAGLSVQLPTGEYMDDKLINLGTNRFTFRPQVGIMHTRGKWSLETTTFVALYTDNNDFFNGKKLEQDPLYTIHSHLIYTFRPGLWTGISGGYDYGGQSTVDGDTKDDRKQNLFWALSFGCPINRHLGVKVAYIGTRTQESTGLDSDSLNIGLSWFW